MSPPAGVLDEKSLDGWSEKNTNSAQAATTMSETMASADGRRRMATTMLPDRHRPVASLAETGSPAGAADPASASETDATRGSRTKGLPASTSDRIVGPGSL